MAVDLGDEPEVVFDYAAELLLDALEAGAQGPLDVGQRHGGDLRIHFRRSAARR